MSKVRNTAFLAAAICILVAAAASAQAPAGPVGNVRHNRTTIRVVAPEDTSGGGGGPTCGSCQCFPWKIGDRNQSGTTWVASNDSYLYSGAGIGFQPGNTAPSDLSPGPDLAGIIGVSFATPNFAPRQIDIYYSFFPVNRAWQGGDENGPDPGPVSTPAPARLGLTWFNGYGAGSTQSSQEATITVFPTVGHISYGPFSISPFNLNTRYNVFVKTGHFGNGNNGNGTGNGSGGGANDNSFALAGVICFTR